MVVSVIVGLRYMSISILSGCRISRRSRKHKLLLFSCDGVNCRLGCIFLCAGGLFRGWCILCCISLVHHRRT
jgi:hypothetical protein